VIDGEWLIQRGGIDSEWLADQKGNESASMDANFVLTSNGISLEDARDWCVGNEECVAFTFNIKSRVSMVTIDNVFFLRGVEGVPRGDFSSRPWFSSASLGWVTHVLHDKEGKWQDDPQECKPDEKDPELIKKPMKLRRAWWDEKESLWNEAQQEYDLDAPPYKQCCHHPNDGEWVPSIETIRELDTIQRISCNISREEFVEKYESKRTPVILEGCEKDWPAKENWKDFETFIPKFHNHTIWSTGNFQEITWAQVQEKIANNTADIFQRIDSDHLIGPLRQNYTVPPAFQDADIFRHLIDVEKKCRWLPHYPIASISMRSQHVTSFVHLDCTLPSVDNWNTLIAGHYWWVVFPETKMLSHTHSVHCSPECSTNDNPFSWFATVGFNAHKYVFEDGTRPLHILQKPGDTVYMPDHWMHALMALDEDNIAVTQGYVSEATNLARAWKQVLTWGYEEDWTVLYDDVFTEDQRRLARESIEGDIVCVPNDFNGCVGERSHCDYSTFYSSEVDNSRA